MNRALGEARVPRRAVVIAAVLALGAAFALDRVSKNWALSELAGGQSIPLVPTVDLRLVFNPGVAFSLGEDAGPVLGVGIAVLLVALLTWVGIQIRRGSGLIPVILLATAAGGGLGNLYDRVSRGVDGPWTGSVVDMIAVNWFAIFNVADIFTVSGLIGWAAFNFIRRAPSPTTKEVHV